MDWMIYVPGSTLKLLPGGGRDRGRLLAELRLELDGAPAWVDADGPAGAGLIGCFNPLPAGGDHCPMAYQPASQSWQSFPDPLGRLEEAFWIGFDPARRPRPADLTRRNPFPGPAVLLADGQAWTIPVARRLPHVWTLEHGLPGRRPKERYADFCREAERIFAAAMAAEVGDSFGADWTYCCQALAINYRLCPEVISALGLLDDRSAADILAATIELPAIYEVETQKKTAE